VTSLNLAYNQLCGLTWCGEGIYIAEGITRLWEGLKGSSVTTLSLANNALCGIAYGEGTYTAEGITKLCEGLRGSGVTSLMLQWNHLDDKGKKAVQDAAGNGVSITL